jgi:hypothetical protein
MDMGLNTPQVGRVRSVAPWYIKPYDVATVNDVCATTDAATCAVIPAGSTRFFVYTDVQNAPDSNVVVEFNLENPTCP